MPTSISGNCENELFDYTKNNVGFDAWWRFARGQRFGFGWDYNNLDQTRVDYDKAHWNKLWAEYKNTMFDTVSGRLKYQYIKRDADHNFTNDPLPDGGANNPNYLLPFTSAFDLQSNTTNLLKLYLDWTPMTNVGVSFEGTWAKIDYDDVTLRPHQQRQAGLLPERLLEPVRQVEVQRVRQLGGNEVSVEPPVHRDGGRRAEPAAGILHVRESELLRPVRAAESQQFL